MFFKRESNADRIKRLQGEYVMSKACRLHMESVNRYYKEHGTVLGHPSVTDEAAKLIDESIRSKAFPEDQPFSSYELMHEYYEMQRLKNEVKSLGGEIEEVDIPMPEEKPFYVAALDRPIEEITEDIFLRPDAFEGAPWYEDFMLFTRIGVCQPQPEHILEVRKALKMMGYVTHQIDHDGKAMIVPGEQPRKGKAEPEHER